MDELKPDDERLSYWAPQPVDRSRREVRLDRFAREASGLLAGQIGPLANIRSSAGCAVVLRTDSPLLRLRLDRLRHHQPVPVGIDLEVMRADGRITVTHSGDLREHDGALTVSLATGLERGGEPAVVSVWLPLISTCAVAGVAVTSGAVVTSVPVPEPRWLALGDSLVQGFCVQQPSQGWVHRLSRQWRLPVWNLGVGGLQIEPDLFAPALATRQWDLVTVGLGSNHAWRDADALQAADRCRVMCELLSSGGHRRIAWLMPPWKPCESGLGPPEFMGVPLDAAAGARLARIRGDLHAVLADFPHITVVEDALPHDHRLLADGLHPAAYGSALYAQRIAEALA
ncbi:MAG: SGNH/GDSL hydrolase family protein [Planctomycetota bacterium]|jgi:lysophospholipase L1-like esterase